MCGGLALSRSKNKYDAFFYHGGRLVGYLVLGIVAGALGKSLFNPGNLVWLSWISSALIGLTFIALGVQAWKGRSPHFSWFPRRWMSAVYGKGGSFGTGLLTAALPCGWLQTFVLAAVATQAPLRGGVLLFCFWLGTLPALVSMPFISRIAFRPALARAPRLVGMLLVLAGVASFAVRIQHAPYRVPPADANRVQSCHSEH
jgi:uncharacterized protein